MCRSVRVRVRVRVCVYVCSVCARVRMCMSVRANITSEGDRSCSYYKTQHSRRTAGMEPCSTSSGFMRDEGSLLCYA